MLARYKIYRGKLPAGVTLPDGIRQDTRKHTHHCLRPSAAIVAAYLAAPSDQAWDRMVSAYRTLLEERYAADPTPFKQLAELAQGQNVYIGCSCPTKNNPDVNHCHTVLALKFMQQRYPELDVEFP